MNDILTQFDNERRYLQRAGEHLEVLPHISRRSFEDGTHHMVESFDLTSDNAEAVIESQVMYYRNLGASFEWKTYSHDTPADLVARLERFGAEVQDTEALVAIDAAAPGAIQSKVDIRQVSDETTLSDFKSVAESVFGKDYSLTTNALRSHIAANSALHTAYIAYVDGNPASIGRLYLDPQSKFAGLYGGGTLEQFRGHGFYRAVVLHRTSIAAEYGAQYATVDALPTSRPILEKLGFRVLTETTPCVFHTEKAPV